MYSVVGKRGQGLTLKNISFPFPLHIRALAIRYSDRVTSVEWSRWELSVLLKDTPLLIDSSYCCGGNQWKDRLFNHQAKGRSDRRVVLWRQEVSGHQHSTLPVSPGGVQVSSWCQMWSDNPLCTCQNECCFNAIRNSGFTASVDGCNVFFSRIFARPHRSEYCIVFYVWQQWQFLFCQCVKSKHDQTNYCVAEFHLMWKSNWMHPSNWRASLIGKLLTQPHALNISRHAIVGFSSGSLRCTGMALQEVFHLER